MNDLLIHNISMPRKGEMLVIFPDGTIYVCFNGMRERLTQTTVFPVPPHGRLGDLDTLAQQIEHERFHHTHTDGLAARHHIAEYGHFLKAISDAPTIIPGNTGSEQ